LTFTKIEQIFNGTAQDNTIINHSLSTELSWSTGGSYATIFTKSGDQGSAWLTANVNLAAYAGTDLQLRLTVNTTSSWQGDIAVDDLKLRVVPSLLISVLAFLHTIAQTLIL